MNRLRVFLLVSLVIIAVTGAVVTAVARADDIPGVPLPPSPVQGYLDNSNGSGVAINDVYNFSMRVGERFQAVLNAGDSTNVKFDVRLFAPGTMGVTATQPVADTYGEFSSYPKTLAYTAPAAGLYYVDVYVCSPSYNDVAGPYSLAWTCKSPTMTVLRTRSHGISAGSRVSIKGLLRYAIGADAVARAQVRLETSRNDRSWSKGAITTTASNGQFTFKVKATRSSYYRVIFAGTSSLMASRSLAIHLAVK